MSFTLDIKNELTALTVRSSCCRRMLCEGILLCAAPTTDGAELTMTVCNNEAVVFVDRILHERFRKGGVGMQWSGRRVVWTLPGSIDVTATYTPQITCEHCASAFLRGVFLICGTVNSPGAADYHAELLLCDAIRARAVYAVLDSLGCRPRIVDRQRGVGLYFKSSEKIEALLVNIGATSSAFTLMNSKIERTIRNDENRATNCVAKNISKTVEASRKYVTAIRALEASELWHKLTEDVQITAKLRVENPDASLSELAALHNPPITKSGLNHRLAKILEVYQNYIDK